jgi:hypothetical protein
VANLRLAATVGPLIERLVTPNGTVLSDQAMTTPRLMAADLPPNVVAGRYFLYRGAA